jgi:hypothetical protein
MRERLSALWISLAADDNKPAILVRRFARKSHFLAVAPGLRLLSILNRKPLPTLRRPENVRLPAHKALQAWRPAIDDPDY